MQGANQAAQAADDFSDVFTREERDSAADSAAAAEAGQLRDDKGRFAAAKETETSDKTVEAKSEQAVEQSSASEQEPPENRHVPLKELLSERERYKSEKKLREEAERRATEHEAQLKVYRDLQSQQRQAPQAQAPAPQIPDPFTQPEEYAQYQSERQFVARRNDIAHLSERFARRSLGDAVVDEATQWALRTNRANDYFLKSADPYGDLVDDYKRAKVLHEVGNDVEGYRARIEKDIREKVMAELKAGGNKPAPRFPGTLADATQAGTQGAMLSPESIAAEIFDTNRNRRQY